MGDPIYHYVGQDWKKVATAYGPLYTLLSYPLAVLGVTGALWGMKLEALLAGGGTLFLTWRCARLRGLDPKFALIAVGVNPLWVIYAMGGAHNDLIMTLFMMVAVALTLTAERGSRRERMGWSGRDRRHTRQGHGDRLAAFHVAGASPARAFAWSAWAALGCALLAYIVFGIHGVNIVSALNRDAAFVSTDSLPPRSLTCSASRACSRSTTTCSRSASSWSCCISCGVRGAATTGLRPLAGPSWRSR